MEEALSAIAGSHASIQKTERVSGGDINHAYALTLTDGARLFLKTNTAENLPFFLCEAEGLAAIASTGTLRTPRILGAGTDSGKPLAGEPGGARGGYSFLLMEQIMPAPRRPQYWETFGRRLAAMHRAPADAFVPGGKYGFAHDNFIGAGRQENSPRDSWIEFFRDCRLAPQLSRAARYLGRKERSRADWLLGHLSDILVEPERPSLLHGDLWAGNQITGSDGQAWLIDPASYVGHAEADLAMTELFGGFPPAFYDAYREVSPLRPGYAARREIYNLYHLLNHLNLFGPGYLPAVARTLASI